MTQTTNLEDHLQDMQIHFSACISDEVIAERERLQEEKESTKRCLAICTKAFDRLREFENTLQIHTLPCISDKVMTKRERLQEEKESTEQCLSITKTLEHIGQLQFNLSEEFYRDIVRVPEGLMSPKQATANTLQECKDILTNTTIDLEKHIQEINSRLQALFVGGARTSGKDATIQTNVFKDALANQDACQVIVSPTNLISATAGIEGRQWLGQMSNGTVQRLSYDWEGPIGAAMGDKAKFQEEIPEGVTAGPGSIIILGQMNDETLQARSEAARRLGGAIPLSVARDDSTVEEPKYSHTGGSSTKHADRQTEEGVHFENVKVGKGSTYVNVSTTRCDVSGKNINIPDNTIVCCLDMLKKSTKHR